MEKPGLFKRVGIWHIDKCIGGRRICQSTGSAELREAERYLARLMEETRQAQVYGVRPARSFEQAAAKFVLENQHKRQPYPLSWDEQASIFKELPIHLGSMALFAVNTGCRDGEICNLKWEWEVAVTPLNTSVFIIPGSYVKNANERLVVLNKIAMAVIEDQRGQKLDCRK
jgi:integrase